MTKNRSVRKREVLRSFLEAEVEQMPKFQHRPVKQDALIFFDVAQYVVFNVRLEKGDDSLLERFKLVIGSGRKHCSVPVFISACERLAISQQYTFTFTHMNSHQQQNKLPYFLKTSRGHLFEALFSSQCLLVRRHGSINQLD